MIIMEPIAFVKNKRPDLKDDYWGGLQSVIELSKDMPAEAFKGIEAFSHLEIFFYFHKAVETNPVEGASHPRGNINWPEVGIFAQRKKRRKNFLGSTIVKLVKAEGNSIIVEGLDAIDGSPVLDIKPVMKEFLPQGAIKQPVWASELMENYWKEAHEA